MTVLYRCFIIHFFLLIYTIEGLAVTDKLVYQHQNQTKISSVKQLAANSFEIIPQSQSNSQKTIRLVTLDWPPYIDRNVCGNGWVFQLAGALFSELGYRITIEFLPWARSVRMA